MGSKGSIWRLWDLHVHTPESVLSSGFGDWDEYVQTLFRKAIALNIAAIGITDYYTIDGYRKLRKEYLENDAKLRTLFTSEEIEKIKQILVLPNIEFRISKLVVAKTDLSWNRKVNLHLLLSDKIDPLDIESNLLNRLTFEHEGSGEGKTQKLPITRKNLTDVGEKLTKVQEEFRGKDPLWVGMVNASINDGDLVNILDENKGLFHRKYLIGLCADEDLSIVSWGSGGHLARKVLIQKSHLIFSSNKSTRAFLLGKKHSTVKEYKNEFNNLKPCIWGSDAHEASKLFLPDLDNYTWIKADPSFEGLRQIIFEPEERVRIQQNIPEEKTPYQVIDKVRFIDKTSRKFYSPDWIELNANLNAIIGGKSSGKSLLLYHIAKAIAKSHVSKQMQIVPTSIGYDLFIEENPFDLEVLWANGSMNKLSDVTESANQITYIPQLFINQLAEKKGEIYLNQLVESILEQNTSYNTFKTEKTNQIKATNSAIESQISNLFQMRAQSAELSESIKRIGDKGTIEKEILRLQEQIDNLRKESGFTERESTEYLQLTNSKTKNETGRENLNRIIDETTRLENILSTTMAESASDVGHLFEEHNSGNTKLQSIKDNTILAINKASSMTNVALQEYLNQANRVKAILESRYSRLQAALQPYNAKIKNQETLTAQSRALEDEKSKLSNISTLIGQREQVNLKGVECKQNILTRYEQLFNTYKAIRDELNTNAYKAIGDELELSTELYFDSTNFQSFINAFDRRTRLNKFFGDVFNENDDYQYGEPTHISSISSIFEKLKDIDKSGLRIKEEFTKEYLHKVLLSDCFKFRYSIKHKGDDIVKMSPGKRGLVLLQLILHLSNASHPILIDQPEDNLDNRTIYFQLKQFVREKKLKRQIIFVTHNANLIISTDSENIIVANQDGQQAGKDNREFKFEYVSGAIENTFLDDSAQGILYKMGIREHVCDILEGGKEAFQEREEKYGFK